LKIFSGNDCTTRTDFHVIVTDAVKNAIQLLNISNSSLNFQDRLAVMILFTKPFNDIKRSKLLKCSLRKLISNMMNTPLDIYVFNKREHVLNTPEWLQGIRQYVHIMNIHDESWKFPCNLQDHRLWIGYKKFELDYYLMGRWRLTFQMEFLRAMGYSYFLQYDDDTMLNSIIKMNIVNHFRNNQILFGASTYYGREQAMVVDNLAEMTKEWIIMTRFEPQGPLVKHIQSFHGISTFNSTTWDRMIYLGFFIILDVNHWFNNHYLQDYLKYILQSGKDITNRWQEQAVQNMIRLLFIPENKVWIARDAEIGHDRFSKIKFRKWCMLTGIVRNVTI
jgi:hypothetical protein